MALPTPPRIKNLIFSRLITILLFIPLTLQSCYDYSPDYDEIEKNCIGI